MTTTTKTKTIKPRVNSDSYTFSHGAPKGKGCWAFAATLNAPEGTFFSAPLTSYADAQKAAQEHFRGETEIYLLP